jgi:CrcB protein
MALCRCAGARSRRLVVPEESQRVETWTKVFVLSIGGTIGVNARYWLGVWFSRWASPQFPWATFTINVTGSFLIGFLTVVLARWMPHPHFRLLLITGFLGGYTTFSTFENDALILWERGEGLLMSANLVGSVVLGFAAVVLGTAAARGLAEPRVRRDVIAESVIENHKTEHAGPLSSSGTERGNAAEVRPDGPGSARGSTDAR